MKFYVSIDIGGTSIKYGILDENIKFITSGEIATEAQKGGKNILEKVINIVSEYKKEYTLSGVCISTAGMVDCEKGEIIHASDLIPNYTGTQIKKTLEDIFSIPCEVENDVNCAGLAEYFSGSAKGASISLCLTIGTGIGGSIIINDRVFHGFSGSACEVGYMNMFKSKFEDLGATSILVKKVAKLKNCSENHIDGKLIFEMAKNNDEDCIKAIDEMVDILGMGIANICYVINPEVVVLGGGIMAQKDYLYDKIRLSLDKYLIPTISSKTKLEFAKNQNKAGMLGAYYNFISIHKD
ncbi:ROK family protein [Clostridium butyricum]|uniref:ROK family protein n=1 Tax=Clostridium butyricum TaxID=1492 RepID=UPI00168B4BAB|nr:ROK family protein [Clostridium butyricum]MDB2151698.1 ROK family protein [Clostridium butyricum]